MTFRICLRAGKFHDACMIDGFLFPFHLLPSHQSRVSSERNARSTLQKVITLVSGLGRLGSNHNDAGQKTDHLGPANASKHSITKLKNTRYRMYNGYSQWGVLRRELAFKKVPADEKERNFCQYEYRHRFISKDQFLMKFNGQRQLP